MGGQPGSVIAPGIGSERQLYLFILKNCQMKHISYTIREIVFDTGKVNILCMTNQEYSGFLRRKGLKRRIITNKKLFTFSIQLKNHVNNAI